MPERATGYPLDSARGQKEPPVKNGKTTDSPRPFTGQALDDRDKGKEVKGKFRMSLTSERRWK